MGGDYFIAVSPVVVFFQQSALEDDGKTSMWKPIPSVFPHSLVLVICVDSSSGWLHGFHPFVSSAHQWHRFDRQTVIKWHNFPLSLPQGKHIFQQRRGWTLDIKPFVLSCAENNFQLRGEHWLWSAQNSPSNNGFQRQQKCRDPAVMKGGWQYGSILDKPCQEAVFAVGERVPCRGFLTFKKTNKKKRSSSPLITVSALAQKSSFGQTLTELLIDSSCSVVHCSRANYVTRQRSAKQRKAAKSGSLLVCTHLSVLYTIKGHCLQKLKHTKAAPINIKPAHMQVDFRGRLTLLLILQPTYWHHTEWADISAYLWKFYSSI